MASNPNGEGSIFPGLTLIHDPARDTRLVSSALKLTKPLIVLQRRCRKVREEETAFLDAMKTKTNGELYVRGKVLHPGVEILIGRSTYQVREVMSWVRFRYDSDKRRIKAIPLIRSAVACDFQLCLYEGYIEN